MSFQYRINDRWDPDDHVCDSGCGCCHHDAAWLYLRSGSFEPWLYLPRPAGDLWPPETVELDG